MRPTILLLDPRTERLHKLGRRLAGLGYEVVPEGDLARGERFAAGLDGALIVVAAEALAGSTDREGRLAVLSGGHGGRTVVVLGAPEDEEGLPETVGFLAVGGLTHEEVARRLSLVLLGRELGAQPDAALESLVGDLAHTPFLELVRGLLPAGVTGRLDLRGGSLGLDGGRVVAANAGPVQGFKAFCRLGRLHEGPFRIVPGILTAAERDGQEITEDLNTLVFAAVEDSLGEFPDPRVHLEVEMGPAFFSTPFTPLEQQILSSAHRGITLGELLDALPARDGEIVQEVLRLEERGLLVRKGTQVPPVEIVTDSTADLPPDLARAQGITVVPLSVAFGKEVFRDRVDLQPGDFYRRLARKDHHPVSSPPPSADLARVYRQAFGRGHDVISLHLSSKLSKTLENAGAAAGEAHAGNPDGNGARLVDTGQVSLGLGLLTLFAARLAAQGEPADSIHRRLLAMVPRVHSIFVLDTLEYLARGGRIGKARAFVGGLLGIRPILGMVDGEITPVDSVRGSRAAHPRILEILEKRLEKGRPVIAGLSHGNAPASADRLEGLLRARFQVAELIEAEVGPVVGTHAGPGIVALALFQPTDEEAALLGLA